MPNPQVHAPCSRRPWCLPCVRAGHGGSRGAQGQHRLPCSCQVGDAFAERVTRARRVLPRAAGVAARGLRRGDPPPDPDWTAQQLRNATMDGEAPAVLLRDRDDKFGPAFARAGQRIGAKVIRTAVRAPNMNAVAERFVDRCAPLLDHVLVLDETSWPFYRQYQLYFNESRPHQVIRQRVPTRRVLDVDLSKSIEVASVRGGLHVDYHRAA